MNVFVLVCLVIVSISESVKSETPAHDEYDETSKDNSVFDKILSINQKAARSRSGGHQPKLIEGDIVETPSVKQMMAGGLGRGAATNNEYHIWPIKNGYYEIPYVINQALYSYTSAIKRAMGEWMEKVPCLKFVPRTNQRGYLHYYSGSGCSSAVGNQRRMQYVSLGRGCLHHGIIVHEIGHALGFWHEQSRKDRDRYIRINYENIIPDMRYNFNIMTGTDDTKVAYDYGSIMHYGPRAFTSNGRDTITPLKYGATIGQRQHLSAIDVQQAKLLYKACESTTGGGTTGGGTTGGGTTGGGTTGGGTTGGTNEGCSDYNRNCKYWADKGECQRNPRYMMWKCKKACCKNSNISCQRWARRGECEKNPNYMVPNCRAACNKCGCKS